MHSIWYNQRKKLNHIELWGFLHVVDQDGIPSLGKKLFCSVGKLSCYLFCHFCHVLPFLFGAERSCNLNGTILPIHLYLNGISLIPFISDFS